MWSEGVASTVNGGSSYIAVSLQEICHLSSLYPFVTIIVVCAWQQTGSPESRAYLH